MGRPNFDAATHAYPPWQCEGEAFVLNYWLSPSFLKRLVHFGLKQSHLGRVIHLLIIRYHHTPVGPYDALVIIDHPFFGKQRCSNIPFSLVSNLDSVDYGHYFWGIPKQYADFSWQIEQDQVRCTIQYQGESLLLILHKHKNAASSSLDSQQLSASILNVHQNWQQHHYKFQPKFTARLCKLKHVVWQQPSPNFLPNFDKSRLLPSFFLPSFRLILPTAIQS